MAKLLFTTIGSLGDLHPPMGLAAEMQKRGHQVTLAASEYYRSYIETAGLTFKAVRPNIEPHNKMILRAVLEPIHGSRVLHENYIFPSMPQYYEDLFPLVKNSDLFVSSILGYVAPLMSHTTGTPWVNALLSPMALWSAYEPPVLPPIRWFRYLWHKTPGLNRWLLDSIFKSFSSMAEPMQLLRERVGLPRLNLYREGQHSHPLLLCLWSPLFGAPQLDWPNSAQTSGFVFYDPKEKEPLSQALEAFLTEGSEPLVFTLGSTMVEDSLSLIELMIEAAKITRERAIITVGKTHLERFQPRSHKRLLFVDYAPYEKLFPRAKVLIHQGGVGTTGQALRSGKPMLVLPSVMDQIDNAERVKRMGAGHYIFPSQLSAERLAEKILKISQDEKLTTVARQLGNKIGQENGVVCAADALEKMIHTTKKL
jgi:rhamnosyltransferase subunit B